MLDPLYEFDDENDNNAEIVAENQVATTPLNSFWTFTRALLVAPFLRGLGEFFVFVLKLFVLKNY